MKLPTILFPTACASLMLAGAIQPLAAQDDPQKAISDEDREKWTRLQIFLDDAEFNPGKIDGRWGEFTGKALKRYLQAQGKEAPDLSAEPSEIPVDTSSVSKVFTEYKITEEDAEKIGSLPEEPKDQAEKEALPYTDLLELVAEKYHADKDFVRTLNKEKELGNLKAGDSLVVPNVKAPFSLSEVKGAEDAASMKGARIEILTKEQQLEVYDDSGKLASSYPITPGSESLPAPEGEWQITSITYMPDFRYDEKMLKEGKRSDEAFILPPGPNSPVGIVWMALSKDGIGIHGTAAPDTIGRSASHGCIRLSNWDAWELSRRVPAETKVVIR